MNKLKARKRVNNKHLQLYIKHCKSIKYNQKLGIEQTQIIKSNMRPIIFLLISFSFLFFSQNTRFQLQISFPLKACYFNILF